MAVENYTEADFVEAVKLLLPLGDYWGQSNDQIDGLVSVIGKELYQAYLDNMLLFLNQDNRSENNWRVSDYQSLLDLYQKGAIASDSILTPAVIDIKLSSVNYILEMLSAVEQMRLPHTAINWRLQSVQGVAAGLRMVNYFRIEAAE